MPYRKHDAVRRFASHVSYSLTAFYEIRDFRDGKLERELVDVPDLSQLCLTTVEQTADLIHEMGHRRAQ